MRRYIETLLSAGDVLITDKPVDPTHQLAAITQKVQQTSNRPIVTCLPFVLQRVDAVDLDALFG